MDFVDVLRRRKAVRSYLDEPSPGRCSSESSSVVGRSRVRGIARACASSLVTDGRTRKAIADIADEDHYVEHGHEPWISRAPAHVVVCAREEDYHDRYNEADKLVDGGMEVKSPAPFWYVDAGAA